MSEEEVPTGVRSDVTEAAGKGAEPKSSSSGPAADSRENTPAETPAPGRDEAEGWVDRYGEILYRFALVRVKDPVAAEDLVQETFVAALRGHKKFQGRSSLKSWLVAILKHKIVDHFRQGVKEKVLENFDSLADQAANDFDDRGKWKFRPQNWAVNPEKLYRQQEFINILYECLARLRGRLAEIFMLREIDGLSTEEICNELNITATNSWVMLYRARAGLRSCLEDNWMDAE